MSYKMGKQFGCELLAGLTFLDAEIPVMLESVPTEMIV